METETPDHEQQHEDQDPDSIEDSWLVRACMAYEHNVAPKDMALFGITVHDKTWCFNTWKFSGNIGVKVFFGKLMETFPMLPLK